MTAHARPAAALVLVVSLYGIPVAGMRVYLQACSGAMTGHANVSVAVAGTAGLQVPPRLGCMIRRPLMARKDSATVARLALGGVEYGMIGPDVAKLDIAELPPMGLKLEVRGSITIVALLAVLLIVTT